MQLLSAVWQISYYKRCHAFTCFRSNTPSSASWSSDTNFVVKRPKLFSWRLGVWSAILKPLLMHIGIGRFPTNQGTCLHPGISNMSAPICIANFDSCQIIKVIIWGICQCVSTLSGYYGAPNMESNSEIQKKSPVYRDKFTFVSNKCAKSKPGREFTDEHFIIFINWHKSFCKMPLRLIICFVYSVFSPIHQLCGFSE